jgi:hypothetical protein
MDVKAKRKHYRSKNLRAQRRGSRDLVLDFAQVSIVPLPGP